MEVYYKNTLLYTPKELLQIMLGMLFLLKVYTLHMFIYVY